MSGWSKEEVFLAAEKMRQDLRAEFEKVGEVRPRTYLFATKNPETEQEGKGLVFLPAMGRFDEKEKAFYATLLRLAGEACKAQGVIFISEMWMVVEQTREEVTKWAGKIHTHPERREALMMSIEHHRIGTATWIAFITRDAKNKPTLEAWDEKLLSSSEGRFMHLLPPVN